MAEHSARRYLSNTSWMMSEKILRMPVALVVNIAMARYLGPDQYGVLSYALSFVLLFLALDTLGLEEVVVRNLVREPEEEGLVMGTAVGLRYMGTVLVIAVVYVLQRYMTPDPYTRLVVMVVALATLIHPLLTLEPFFQAKVQASCAARSQLAGMVVGAVAKLSLIPMGMGVAWFAGAMGLEQAAVAVFMAVMFLRTGRGFRAWRFSWAMAGRLLSASWPLILSGLAILTSMRIDQVMIKEMMGDAALGNYAVAVRMSEVWYLLPAVLAASLFPAIVSARELGREVVLSRITRLFVLNAWLGAALVLPVIAVADWAVDLLFGDAYDLAAGALRIHICTTVFVGIGVARQKWLLAENNQRYHLFFALMAVGVNVLLNLALIPRMGINGAAWATFASQALSVLFFPLFFAPVRVTAITAYRALNPALAFREAVHTLKQLREKI